MSADDLTAVELLAQACREVPELAALPELPWLVSGRQARASLHALASMRARHEAGSPGSTLVITPAPDALPMVLALHEAGWTRDGERMQWGWELDARLERGGAALIVSGTTHQEPGHGNPALPYFAPPPPELPCRAGNETWLAEYQEWQRKCAEREW